MVESEKVKKGKGEKGKKFGVSLIKLFPFSTFSLFHF